MVPGAVTWCGPGLGGGSRHGKSRGKKTAQLTRGWGVGGTADDRILLWGTVRGENVACGKGLARPVDQVRSGDQPQDCPRARPRPAGAACRPVIELELPSFMPVYGQRLMDWMKASSPKSGGPLTQR